MRIFREINLEFRENFTILNYFIFTKFRETQNNFAKISCSAKFLKCCFAATLVSAFLNNYGSGSDIIELVFIGNVFFNVFRMYISGCYIRAKQFFRCVPLSLIAGLRMVNWENKFVIAASSFISEFIG